MNPLTASITFSSSPAVQTLPNTVSTAVIPPWGAPTGGTAPYTYSLTQLGVDVLTVSGSDLGPYSIYGMTAGATYVFQITATDALGAKGYAITSVSTQPATANWIVVQQTDFTDTNWTALSSTDTTQSTTVPQLILYAADGVTKRAEIWNNSSQARRLELSPGGDGLILATESTGASPFLKVVPIGATGQNVFQTLNYSTDIIKVEFIGYTEENAGTAAFVRLFGFGSASSNTAIQHGFRIISSGTGVLPQRRSASPTLLDISQSVYATGATRKLWLRWEGYLTGSRTVESYAQYSNTTALEYPTVARSGKYYYHQSASQVQTATPALVDFGSTSTADQFAILLYNDGSVIDGGVNLSRMVLTSLRVSKLANGSKPTDYMPSVATAFSPAPSIVAPARQSLSPETISASITYTHPGAPSGMTYSITVNNIATGAVITATGAALGPYVFPVSYGQDYVSTLTGLTASGQPLYAVAYVSVLPYAYILPGTNPTSLFEPSDATSLVFAAPAVSGGIPAVTYSSVLTKPAGSSAALTGTAPGSLTISGPSTDGQAYLIRVTATDAVGSQAQNSFIGAIAQADVYLDLEEATPPADQSLAEGTSTVTLSWTYGGALENIVYTSSLYNFLDQSTGAAVSGSGLGPYVFNVSSGNTYASYTREQGPTGQIQQSKTSSVKVAQTTGWVVKGGVDLTTNITAGSTTGISGNVNILSGDGVTVKVVGTILISGTGTSRSATWGTANGIVISITDNNDATTYTYQFLLNLTSLATITDWSKPVLIEAIVGNLVIPSDADGTECGVAVNYRAALDNGYGRATWINTGSVTAGLRAYSTSSVNTTAGAAYSLPSGDSIIQFLIRGGNLTTYLKNDVAAFQNGIVASPGFTAYASYANTGYANASAALYSAGLFLGPYTGCKGVLTSGLAIKKVQILQYNWKM